MNIRGDTQKHVIAAVDKKEIHIDLFDDAQTEVLRLLEKDSFVRFKQSDFFERFLKEAAIYEKNKE